MRWLAMLLVAASCGGGGGGGGDGGGDGAGGDAGIDARACGNDVTPAPGIAFTENGAVQGVAAGNSWAWKGIPYAQPPVGDLRFRAPATLTECWSGARDTTQFGAVCPQLDGMTGALNGDEDCLTLNIWAPNGAVPGDSRAVLVFIHGGGHVQGASSLPIYDGQLMAQHDVVVVTINYRLGALGTLVHTALTAEAGGPSGNYGVRDELLALGWVHRNVREFGGDPGRVMVFGESAGAVDTCLLVTSPASAGLFQAALMESGGCVAHSQTEAEAFGDVWAMNAGCDTAPDVPTCLRGLTLAQVMATMPPEVSLLRQNEYQPWVDGDVVPLDPMDAFAAGSHQHVAFAIGDNSDETSRDVPAVATDPQYQMILRTMFGDMLAADIVAIYPSSDYPTPKAALVAVTTDARFICPARRVARAVEAAQTEPVYRYLFTHALENGPAGALGAFHGLELAWVFGNFSAFMGYTPTDREVALSQAMQGYWTRFGGTGDPNGPGADPWPAYAAGSDLHVILDDNIMSGDGLRTTQCDFWDGI